MEQSLLLISKQKTVRSVKHLWLMLKKFISCLINNNKKDVTKKVDCVWNVMAHAQKPDFAFRQNRRVHLNRQRCQFSQLLTAEVCESAVIMLDTPCSEVMSRVLATHSIRQFPLHFPSCASPCAITFQLDSTTFLHALPIWMFPCICVFCTPKSQYVYGLMQTGT
jgi:hypothetical protein